VRSKAWVCGRSLFGIAGSHPAGGRDVSLSLSLCCDCSVLSGAGLCDRPVNHPEESYLVGCVGVRSRNLDNEESLVH